MEILSSEWRNVESDEANQENSMYELVEKFLLTTNPEVPIAEATSIIVNTPQFPK
jgi:hypothetical protein